MRRLEALVDALAEYAGSANPSNELYQLRNPIGLRAFSDRHGVRGEYRRFQNLCDGYQAALYDLEIKCSGRSRASGLGKTEATLRDLARVFCFPPGTERQIAKFLCVALESEISPETRLEYFKDDANV